MPCARIVNETKISNSFRVKKICGSFDFDKEKVTTELDVDIPIEGKEWNVGLIVGSSGSGKTTIAKSLFPEFLFFKGYEWNKESFVDDFPEDASVEEIISAIGSVGLNSVPDWLKPFNVLSNGEKMRAEMARLLFEKKPVIYDEFTSVVDRDVAKFASCAIAKFVRKENKKIIFCSCHRDIIDWLCPDFIYDTDSKEFEWRCLRRRPNIKLDVFKADKSFWDIFKKYHYLNSELNSAAVCFVAVHKDRPIGFCAVLYNNMYRVRRVSRLVILPDYQGCGIGKTLLKIVGEYYREKNEKLTIITSLPFFSKALSHDKNFKLYSMGHQNSFKNTKFKGRCKTESSKRYTYSFLYTH